MPTAALTAPSEDPAGAGDRAAADTAPAPSDPAAVSVAALYRQMWAHAAGARGVLVLSSVMLVAAQVVRLLVPWLTAQAIDTLQRGRPGAGAECLRWIAAIVAVYAASWSLHGPGRVIERVVALRVRRSLTDQLYTRLADAPLAWHALHHPAELAHRVSQSTQALTGFTQSQFVYLQNAVNLAGPLLALGALAPATGGIACAGLLLIALTIAAFDRAMIRLAHRENRAERLHAAALLDCLGNITTVLSLGLREPTRRLLARRLAGVVQPVRASIALTEWKWCAVDLLGIGFVWSLVAFHAWTTGHGGALMLGGVFMVYQYAQQAGGVIGSLASTLQNFARIRTDCASAAPIWEAPQRRPVPAPATGGDWQRIDLCDLSFRHPAAAGRRAGDAQHPGLQNVCLRLAPGERIALVGPSGCGKSTLLRLVAGLHEPTRGHVEVDGVATLCAHGLGRRATLIPQEAQIFESTLRENVAFDLPWSDADVMAAARVAALDEVIEALPQGLATPVAQGGANLSGGQRQRVALARGVLAARGSSVLLLDEPTSALDPLTEQRVHERLHAAFAGACIVASVHRMSLLARFDRVVLLEAGRVVDSGTVAELASRQRLFREMLQAEGGVQGVEAGGAEALAVEA